MHRGYLVALVVVLVAAGLAVAVALRTDPESVGTAVDPTDLPTLAESVPGADLAAGWLNSDPLTADDLAEKVVVYDFWTYSCVNCVRTLPYLRAWYDRYRDDGLVVIGVHSPEFDFERDPDNVARAVDELGVDYPVALDPEMAIWNAFGNQYWPAKYVVDRDGALRYYHFGEGGYDETEDVLRELLGVDPASPRADDGEEDAGAVAPAGATDITPETYLGNLRGRTASPEGLTDPDGDGTAGGTATFTVPAELRLDDVALEGRWTVEAESVTAEEAGAAIVLRYQAAEVNLVLGAGGAAPDGSAPSTSVLVSVDGGEERTVAVEGDDLVNLLRDGPAGEHTIRIEATAPGLAAFAFTFGT